MNCTNCASGRVWLNRLSIADSQDFENAELWTASRLGLRQVSALHGNHSPTIVHTNKWKQRFTFLRPSHLTVPSEKCGRQQSTTPETSGNCSSGTGDGHTLQAAASPRGGHLHQLLLCSSNESPTARIPYTGRVSFGVQFQTERPWWSRCMAAGWLELEVEKSDL